MYNKNIIIIVIIITYHHKLRRVVDIFRNLREIIFPGGWVLIILCVLMKEMSDHRIKGFNIWNFFRLRRAHIMCFDKGNDRSWNKEGPTFQIFRLRRAHNLCFNKINVRSRHTMVSNFKKGYCIIDKCELRYRNILTEIFSEKKLLPEKNFFLHLWSYGEDILIPLLTSGMRWSMASLNRQPIARATIVERTYWYHHLCRSRTTMTPNIANKLQQRG